MCTQAISDYGEHHTVPEICGVQFVYACCISMAIMWKTNRRNRIKDGEFIGCCTQITCCLPSKLQGCCVHVCDSLDNVFTNALSFVYAWAWANFGNDVVFGMYLNCLSTTTTLPSATVCSYQSNIAWAFMLTALCIHLSAQIKTEKPVQASGHEVANAKSRHEANNQLTLATCGLVVGWQFTNAITVIVADISASPSFSSDKTVSNLFVYVILLLILIVGGAVLNFNVSSSRRLLAGEQTAFLENLGSLRTKTDGEGSCTFLNPAARLKRLEERKKAKKDKTTAVQGGVGPMSVEVIIMCMKLAVVGF